MSRERRAEARRANGHAPGARELPIPAAPARRILRLMAEKAAIERVIDEALQATLETLGCDLEANEDPTVGWGVFDGKKPGTLVARYGPKPGRLDTAAILRAVKETLPPGAEGETGAKPN